MSKPPLPSLPLFAAPGAPSFEQVATCVHCGLCLEACPTYRELRVEMDSPRGRIYLMKGLLEGRLAPEREVLRHLDQCLDCRACETACPSGVPYGQILERTRSVLQPRRPSGPLARLLRAFTFGWLLRSRRLQALVFAALRLGQALGLNALAARLGRRGWLGRLGRAAAQAPRLPPRSFRAQHAAAFQAERDALVFPARGQRQRRVALLSGCLADHLLPEVTAAAVRVLTENGCEVEVLAGEGCCGALHLHNGARAQAQRLARQNLAAFSGRAPDLVVSTAAGCSAELRHYGQLLDGDAEAVAFGRRVRDVSELLVEIGFRVPRAAPGGTGTMVYDEPCHLLHAQRISAAPRQVLGALSGLPLVPLDEADACCGSAGLYSVLQPQLAERIAARKLAAIQRSGARLVASGNPGCILQIRQGLAAAGQPVEVIHPVELLARAYAAEEPDPPAP